MSRTHIHFATAGRHMRRNAWADVLLLLDLQRALQVRWWETLTNNVMQGIWVPASTAWLACMPPLKRTFLLQARAGRIRVLAGVERRAAL